MSRRFKFFVSFVIFGAEIFFSSARPRSLKAKIFMQVVASQCNVARLNFSTDPRNFLRSPRSTIGTPTPPSCRKFFSAHRPAKSTALIKSGGTKNFRRPSPKVFPRARLSKCRPKLARKFFPKPEDFRKEPLESPTRSKIFHARATPLTR